MSRTQIRIKCHRILLNFVLSKFKCIYDKIRGNIYFMKFGNYATILLSTSPY
jgi:hypothetical protein